MEPNIFLRAKGQYGKDSQLLKAVEELNELAVVLTKLVNGKKIYETDIITEIADVEIMMEQLRYYFDPDLIDFEKTCKLQRLKARLDSLIKS